MEEEKFNNFKWRLKTIGTIHHHDNQWKEIFQFYGLKWEEWWNDYCQGMHNLVGSFSDDEIRDENDEIKVRYFSSIFGEEGENLFIKWLFKGHKKDLLPFYDWFCKYMKRKQKESINFRENSVKNTIPIKQKGYIYLLKSKNFYKIGKTKYLKDRMKAYKTENPFEIEIIIQKEVEDYVKIEKELLKKFEDKQIKGEWFKLNKDDVEEIKKYLL